MLTITVDDGVARRWYVGMWVPNVDPITIVALQADSDELNHIIHLFTHDTLTIPLSRESVNVWYGDIARTIYSALRWRPDLVS